MASLRYLLKLSRFRFWIYTAGPFVVGYALGIGSWEDLYDPEYLTYLAYFFLPANVFIYGVNDWWDRDTDARNPKKEGREMRVEGEDRSLLILLYSTVVASFVLLILQGDVVAQAILLAFLAISYWYSAPPLRFKAVPFLDFSSNVLYIIPGVLGYYLASGDLVPPLIFLGGFAHISAMHIFSAIPDIDFDREAGIETTPVLVGRRNALLMCLAFWSLLSLLMIYLAGLHPFSFLVLVYPLFPAAVLMGARAERAYWYLPYANWGLGGLLFVMVVLSRTGAL